MAMSASFLAPLFELAQDDVVKEKALEAAKQFFTNSNITINLLPALIAGALLLLLGLPLIALLFQPAADTSATGYGPPAEEYGAPSSSYGSAYSRSGYEEYRSLLSDLIDSNAGAVPEFELTKRMQQLAEPVINKIADTAAHFIQ
jgi:hypothetical protein